VLNYPKNHEAWFDIVMNEHHGDWYEERNPITLAPNIDVPVYLQLDQGRGWTLDGTIEVFNELKGPKKLDLGPYPPMQSRPFIEEPKDIEYMSLYLRPRHKLSPEPEPMGAEYAARMASTRHR
jgi:hypothetical protein